METKIRKDNKMLKRVLDEIYLIVLLILLLILASGSLHAQSWDAPSGYTDYAGLRLYATGANAGSDSLNQNLIDIDSLLDAHQDTINAIKADLYGISDYSGGYKDASIAWADLSTAAKSNIVQTSGAQSIAGVKTFTDGMLTEGLKPSTGDIYNIGGKEERYNRMYSNYMVTGSLIINTGLDNDSVVVTYNGETITFDKPLELNKGVVIKDSTKFSAIALSGGYWIPVLTTDSVIVLDSTMSSLYIINKTFTLPNIERITMVGAGHEQILVITGYTANAVTFEDTAPDGNLHLSGNFAMSTDDIIVLKYNANAGYWAEVSRSNN